MEITRELYEQQQHHRFGTANPERMRLAHWESMVRGGRCPHHPREDFGIEYHCGRAEGPDWCFVRLGSTRTELADGRVIDVGGEYEDFYDPDFCIYNDVVVRGPGDTIEIYGYPKDVFPPTDFHSATLVDGRIVLIGCLGYPQDRVPGLTPAYSLNLVTYRIETIEMRGESPGWIHEHRASFDPGRAAITVQAGQTIETREDQQYLRWNVDTYRLHLNDGRWERLTRRAWPQFAIEREDRRALSQEALWQFGPDDLRPKRVGHTPLPRSTWRVRQFRINGVRVRVSAGLREVRILVRGELPGDVVQLMVEDIQANIEKAIGHPCRVVELR
jgi:hypothetical protein